MNEIKTVLRFVELAEESPAWSGAPRFLRDTVLRLKVLAGQGVYELETFAQLWEQAKKETQE